MRRAYKFGAAAAAPLAPPAPSVGYPTEGDVLGGTPSTIPGAWWHHMITEAIVSVIEQAGLVPDDTPMQFRDAVLALGAQPVTRLSTTRNADAVDINYDTTTQLGSLDLTKTGYWLLQLSGRVRVWTNVNRNRIRLRIDGVVVEAAVYSGLPGPNTLEDRSAGVRCVVRNKSAGDRVTADGFSSIPHRYSSMSFEAFYLGPAA